MGKNFEEHSEIKQNSMNKFICALFVVAVVGLASGQTKLQERFSWRQMDWVFPSQQIRERAIASGDYIPTNGLPVGIERWQNKLFVSVPRWRNGQCNPEKLCLKYFPTYYASVPH